MRVLNWVTLAISIVALVFGVLVFRSVQTLERQVDKQDNEIYHTGFKYGARGDSRIDDLEYEVDDLESDIDDLYFRLRIR